MYLHVSSERDNSEFASMKLKIGSVLAWVVDWQTFHSGHYVIISVTISPSVRENILY